MEKYGFFGGSFNPPTYAHLENAKKALKEIGLSKVFLVPVGNYYIKPGLKDEKDRLCMLNLMCEGECNIEVEDIELNLRKKMTAIDAFRKIENKYKTTENYFIMGADNFVKIPSWNDSMDLLKKYNLIVFNRESSVLKSEEKNIKILTIEEYNNCRSGIIRELARNKEYGKMEVYTKKEVINYIREKKIYE